MRDQIRFWIAFIFMFTGNACCPAVAFAQQLVPTSPATQPPPSQPTINNTPVTEPAAKQKQMSRIWANEPPLVRLARDHFGAELTETDAKFFACVAANDWADFRESNDATYDAEEPSSWAKSPVLKADRIAWLCSDPQAAKLVPNRGIWLRGVSIEGNLDLYRIDAPVSFTFYDCLLSGGLNIAHAKLQELDIRNCCSAAISARGVQIAENVYLLNSAVYGGLDFIDAQVQGDFDYSGGLAFHSVTAAHISKPGIAINMHDAKIGGELRLADKFRALGQVRLIGTQIGRGLACGNGQFSGNGELAIDARRCTVGSNVLMQAGFKADGGVELRRAKLAADLECDGGHFIASGTDALNADLIEIAGQLHMGDGFKSEGEVRFINATVGGDIDCDNGQFLNPSGDALSLDGAVIGRSLRMGIDHSTSSSEDSEDTEANIGFLARGCVRLWGTKIDQDVLCNGARFETPTGTAILANNIRVGSRVVLSGVKAEGTVNLFGAEIEHELDCRGSHFDARQTADSEHIALLGNGMHVSGHVYCNQVVGSGRVDTFRVDGQLSVQFATIGMHWDLSGAELINPNGNALEASDIRVGGYVNLDTVAIEGRASFSRAKIDGMWVLLHSVHPELCRMDLRFAQIWVIKDERLEDWPSAGQLQLEGLVYNHFDDDSPLDVQDRLAWLRRQYPSRKTPTETVQPIQTTMLPRESIQTGGHFVDHRVVRTGYEPNASEKVPISRDIHEEPLAETPSAEPAPGMAAPEVAVPGMAAPSISIPPVVAAPARRYEMAITAEEAQSMAEPSETIGSARPPAGSPVDGATDLPAPASIADDLPSLTPTTPSSHRYVTQPYTQLASVYRAIGQDEQASTVLVARAERIGELSPLFSAQGLWYRYLGRLIGYGYEPFRAIKIGLVIVLVGSVVFAIGARRNLMAETKLAEEVISVEGESRLVSATYPRFNPLVYSLDVFLPFVDLLQICYWLPGEKHTGPRRSRNCLMHVGPWSIKWSGLLRAYFWFQTLAGWTLCTLLAAAVTGIVQS